MEFEGFGNNNEDSEYELKLTPEIRIIFEGAGDFYLEAEFADYNPGKYKDLNLLDFSIKQKLGRHYEERISIWWHVLENILLCEIKTFGEGFTTRQDIYGDEKMFGDFLKWLWKRENSQQRKDEIKIYRALDNIPRRKEEFEELLDDVIRNKPLEVKTLLTAQHVDAISRLNTLISYDTPHYYYVLDATDVQIQGAVDKYPILNLDSLLGLLQTPNNRNVYTRQEISRIRKIKFVPQTPTEIEKYGAPRVGLKRSRSIGGGKAIGGKVRGGKKKSRKSRKSSAKK